MASEPAEPTTRPQEDRVGTVRRLGNSWFVKLVEPAPEPWHVVCSDGQQDVSGWQDDESMEDCEVVGYLPVVECVPGLLADPAQTTELERLRDAVPKLRDAYQAKLGDFAAETLRTSRALRACTVTPINEHVPRVVVGEALLGWRGAQEHIRAEITRDLDPEDVDARADLLTEVGLLRAERHVLTAERDALSLLLRGMARKLVAYRKWALKAHRDQDWVLNRVRAALGTPDGRAVSVHAAEVCAERDLALWLFAEARWYSERWLSTVAEAVRLLRNAGVNRGNGLPARVATLIAERDERHARIDAALQLIHVFTATGPRFLSPDETREVRAALVGDQPTEANFAPLADEAREIAEQTLPVAAGMRASSYRVAVAAAMSEEELEDAVIEAAQFLGWTVVHHRPARTKDGEWRTAIKGQKGFPDLCLARDGTVLLRELKREKGKTSPGQVIWLEALGDHGGIWRPSDWLSGRIQHELRRVR
jgi:hypothetical protein